MTQVKQKLKNALAALQAKFEQVYYFGFFQEIYIFFKMEIITNFELANLPIILEAIIIF